jgi:hypothetical protein
LFNGFDFQFGLASSYSHNWIKPPYKDGLPNGLRLSRRGNWQKKAWLDYKPVRADKAKA